MTHPLTNLTEEFSDVHTRFSLHDIDLSTGGFPKVKFREVNARYWEYTEQKKIKTLLGHRKIHLQIPSHLRLLSITISLSSHCEKIYIN